MILPNFIVGGAPKAGTTSLYHYLASHPDIFMCRIKEPDYFHKHYDRGVDWYASLFEGHTTECAVGEASPGTLASPEAVERIYALVPAMRFVFVLRDPVERAHSQYLYALNMGTQSATPSFSTFIRDESDPWRNRLVELGMYADQLERYAERFGRGQLYVFLFEDLKRDREGSLRKIYKFLGVDPEAASNYSVQDEHNVTAYPRSLGAYRFIRALWDPVRDRMGSTGLEQLHPLRSWIRAHFFTTDRRAKPPLSDHDRTYLAEIYRESNGRVEAFLGRDLSHWT